MIAAPAVDIRGGRSVQLVGGDPGRSELVLGDPVEGARRWWERGFRHLHVVDLDGALGDGTNRRLVRGILRGTGARVQVGGGVRTGARVRGLLREGAARVVVGTRAVEDPAWLARIARAHPGRIVVAADVRDGRVLVRGWRGRTDLAPGELIAPLRGLPLAGLLCTDVAREGRMAGFPLPLARSLVREAAHPVWVAGGIRSVEELRALADLGVSGAVLGMALYTGVLDPDAVAQEFGG